MKVSVSLRLVTHQGDYMSPCGDTRLLEDHSEIPATAAPSSHLGGLVHPLAGLLKEWSTAVSIPESPRACAKQILGAHPWPPASGLWERSPRTCILTRYLICKQA